MEKITVWTLIENEKESHNHIENGWSDLDYPLPIDMKFENQKSWSKKKWKKEHAYFFNNKVVRIDV